MKLISVIASIIILSSCSSTFRSTQGDYKEYEGKGSVEYDEEYSIAYLPEMRTPKFAADNGIEGNVVLRYDINEQGEVQNIRAQHGENMEVFIDTAISLLSEYRYKPRIRNGVPQTVKNAGIRLSFCFPEKYSDNKFKFQHRSKHCATLHP